MCIHLPNTRRGNTMIFGAGLVPHKFRIGLDGLCREALNDGNSSHGQSRQHVQRWEDPTDKIARSRERYPSCGLWVSLHRPLIRPSLSWQHDFSPQRTAKYSKRHFVSVSAGLKRLCKPKCLWYTRQCIFHEQSCYSSLLSQICRS